MKTGPFLLGFLCLAWPELVPAADVGFYGVIKSSEFVQTSAGAPVGRPTNGFAFNAFVLANANHVVTSATVKPANTTPLRTLLAADTNNASWRFEERFNSQTLLDTTYPNGNIILPIRYTNMMVTVNDGTKSATLEFASAAVLGNPPTPQITNFSAAQTIDTTTGFRLGWSLPGGSTLDIVQLIITDPVSNGVFASAAPFASGALNGTSNFIVIPPNTLPPGTNLVGHLSIVRVGLPNTNAYPGAVGIPGLLRDTEFPLVTRPVTPPWLTVLTTSAEDFPFQFRCTGESNRIYHVQGTEDFVTWTELFATTNRSSFVYPDPQSEIKPWRFYRVQVGP